MSPEMPTTARWRRAAAAVAVALVACLGTVLITDGPALAHGQFVRSDPAAGSRVSTALETIYLYFTEKPTSNAYFAVTAPSGVRVDRVWTHGPTEPIEPSVHEWFHQSNGDWVARTYHTAYSAQIPIAYWPETGDYTVEFLSVATDGQPVRGKITFSYSGPVSELPANYSPQHSEPDPNLLAVAPPGAPTAPPTGPEIEEVVAQLESGPNLLILWIPIGIVTAAVIAALVYWRMRPEQARELVISRFGGRYAAVTQRRPLALPAALSDRLPLRRPASPRAISSAPEGTATSVPRTRGPVEEESETAVQETAVQDPAEVESSRQEP